MMPVSTFLNICIKSSLHALNSGGAEKYSGALNSVSLQACQMRQMRLMQIRRVLPLILRA
jgi:hypothetical protein